MKSKTAVSPSGIEEYSCFLDAVQEWINAFDDLEKIEPSEVKRLHPLNNRRSEFVETTIQIIREHPDLFPPNMNSNQLQEDYHECHDLGDFLEKVRELEELLKQKYYIKGSETFLHALKYYKHLKAQGSFDDVARDYLCKLQDCGCFRNGKTKNGVAS